MDSTPVNYKVDYSLSRYKGEVVFTQETMKAVAVAFSSGFLADYPVPWRTPSRRLYAQTIKDLKDLRQLEENSDKRIPSRPYSEIVELAISEGQSPLQLLAAHRIFCTLAATHSTRFDPYTDRVTPGTADYMRSGVCRRVYEILKRVYVHHRNSSFFGPLLGLVLIGARHSVVVQTNWSRVNGGRSKVVKVVKSALESMHKLWCEIDSENPILVLKTIKNKITQAKPYSYLAKVQAEFLAGGEGVKERVEAILDKMVERVQYFTLRELKTWFNGEMGHYKAWDAETMDMPYLFEKFSTGSRAYIKALEKVWDIVADADKVLNPRC